MFIRLFVFLMCFCFGLKNPDTNFSNSKLGIKININPQNFDFDSFKNANSYELNLIFNHLFHFANLNKLDLFFFQNFYKYKGLAFLNKKTLTEDKVIIDNMDYVNGGFLFKYKIQDGFFIGFGIGLDATKSVSGKIFTNATTSLEVFYKNFLIATKMQILNNEPQTITSLTESEAKNLSIFANQRFRTQEKQTTENMLPIFSVRALMLASPDFNIGFNGTYFYENELKSVQQNLELNIILVKSLDLEFNLIYDFNFDKSFYQNFSIGFNASYEYFNTGKKNKDSYYMKFNNQLYN